MLVCRSLKMKRYKKTDDIPYLKKQLSKLIRLEAYERCARVTRWLQELKSKDESN